MFTSPERLRLSHSQWRLLFKLTYGIYCTGGTFVSRPEAILEGSRLEINFQTSLEFSEYHQRALSWTPSHLIDFDVEIHSPHYILGKISANHTPTNFPQTCNTKSPDVRFLITTVDHTLSSKIVAPTLLSLVIFSVISSPAHLLLKTTKTLE